MTLDLEGLPSNTLKNDTPDATTVARPYLYKKQYLAVLGFSGFLGTRLRVVWVELGVNQTRSRVSMCFGRKISEFIPLLVFKKIQEKYLP